MAVFTVFLLYISMYLIHNAVGTLCIIKNGDDNRSNEGDSSEASRLFKVNNSNLFAVSNNHISFFAFFFAAARFFYCFRLMLVVT